MNDTAALIARIEALEAEVYRLRAKEACLSAFNEYLHHLDGDRPDELLAVFEPDAVLAVINFPPGTGKDLHFTGRDEIRPLYAAHRGGIGRHHSANITVNVEGTSAELSAYFITSGAYAFGGGLYQLTLRDHGATWLIHHMRIVSTWGWAIPQGKPPYLAEALGQGALREGRPVVYRIT